jgi:glycosyltransferase involved in cell wall biosynthesis
MKVVVSLEYRFDRTPDGQVWTQSMFPYSFWQRYLTAFDGVTVMARAREVERAEIGCQRVAGECVSFAPLPYYIGPWQYMWAARQLRRSANQAIGPDDAVILRVGSQIATTIEPALRRSKKPFGLEVVGDPYDTFAPGAIKHPLRPLFRWSFSRQLQRQCRAASAVAYVTEKALQRRYPTAAGTFSTHYSSIDLTASDFVFGPRPINTAKRTFNLVTIGSLAQLYKAPDVLIDAIAQCAGGGLDLRLIWIGDGKHRREMEAKVAALGLNNRINFLGHLSAGEAVRAQLDAADLFVLPSKTEGLPRAMIEAMARALPCIGSDVGGIPELLAPEDLVPAGDAAALASKIKEVLSDTERLNRMSARNLVKANGYRDDRLNTERTAFYRYLRNHTEAWLKEE